MSWKPGLLQQQPLQTFLSLRLVESWVKQSFKWTFNYSGFWCTADSLLLSQAGLKSLPMYGLLSVNLKLHEVHFRPPYSWSDCSVHHDVSVSPDRWWPDQIFISILLVHPASCSHSLSQTCDMTYMYGCIWLFYCPVHWFLLRWLESPDELWSENYAARVDQSDAGESRAGQSERSSSLPPG